VSEVNPSTTPRYESFQAVADTASTPISPGEVTTSVTITIRYTLG